jgi:2-polyprenyl-6-methoxyphenol hydroxylase-like FAD-dependent oxidoreductase
MPKGFSERKKTLIRAQLLAKGRELFATQGIKKANVEDLTKAANISKGAFYLFFNSKEELFFELLGQFEDEYHADLIAAAGRPGASPRQQVKDVLTQAFRFGARTRCLRTSIRKNTSTWCASCPKGSHRPTLIRTRSSSYYKGEFNMATNKTIDVLIVGAGPTGLALAYQLRRLGLSFRIVEKNATPSTTSKAIALQYRVSELLTWMGLFDRFQGKGVSGTGLRFSANGRLLLHMQLERITGMSGRGAFEPQGVIIPQSETEGLLIDALREQGVTVEYRIAFVSFTQDTQHVISRLQTDAGEELIESRYLVSCEGAHSLIRKQAGISFVGKTYPIAYYMADVEANWPTDSKDIRIWLHEDGMFSALPMPGERRWRLFVESSKQTSAGATEVTLDLIRNLMAQRIGEQAVEISNPTWLTEFRISCRMVDRFRERRVFLAGDAAHIHSPTGGQGITTGLQDAYNLAWKLDMALRGGAPDSLLDSYSEERLVAARSVLKATDSIANIFLAHDRATQLLRDRIVLPLLRTRAMQKRLTRKTSQLEMNYRGFGLSAHQERGLLGRARVRAGDRTPDVLFRDARTNEQTSLFALISRSQVFALIGPGGQPEKITQLSQALGHLGIACFQVLPKAAHVANDLAGLIDVTGDFGRLYGARGEFLYLIRPDGYAGLFQRPIDERALRSYLTKLFTADTLQDAFATIELGPPLGNRA